MAIETLAYRFWQKVNKQGEHWLWLAGTDKDGYGQIWVDEEMRRGRANRVAWFLYYGEWPTLPVLHTCDLPQCIKKEHLFLGTILENNRDRARKGRSAINISPMPGEKNGNAKLTEADIKTIRARFNFEMVRQQDLADEYNVSQVLIAKIVRRELWKHVA
jgi:hypothetical protein